jgi:putative transposase
MGRPLRVEFSGAIWHVTSRGNNKNDIVRSDSDRRRFVRLLAEAVDVHHLVLHAWVLMTNHYHLLVQTPQIGLSDALKDLNEDLARSFNRCYARVGHLFQDRPHIKPVKREAHLLELVRYVVLNPVRAGMARFPGDYTWSSYRSTAGLRAAPPWLEVEWTLRQFHPDDATARDHYRKFVGQARGAAYDPWEAFRLEELEEVAAAVCAVFGLSVEQLKSPGRRSPEPRAAVIQLAALAGSSPSVTAEWLGISATAGCKLRRVANDLYERDREHRSRIDTIRDALSLNKVPDTKIKLNGCG